MLRRALTLGMFLPLLATPVQAALSPYYQSRAEILRILEDPRLDEALGGARRIVSIEQTDVDVFTIKSEACSIEIRIVDKLDEEQAAMLMGPRQFDISFGEPHCR